MESWAYFGEKTGCPSSENGRKDEFDSNKRDSPVMIDLKLGRTSDGNINRNKRAPFCQVYGCRKDLSSSKDYHKKHRVCEVHSKTAKVIVDGIEQRFCQQCSRFHVLAEFDNGKRSCRKRLAGHNQRRRKPYGGINSSKTGRVLYYNGSSSQGTSSTSTVWQNGLIPSKPLKVVDNCGPDEIAIDPVTSSQQYLPIRAGENRTLTLQEVNMGSDIGSCNSLFCSASGPAFSLLSSLSPGSSSLAHPFTMSDSAAASYDQYDLRQVSSQKAGHSLSCTNLENNGLQLMLSGSSTLHFGHINPITQTTDNCIPTHTHLSCWQRWS